MTPYARIACDQAIFNINLGQFEMAIACLRDALRGTHDRKAWSKLMLAIRELNRIAPAPSAQ
jgi:Flp pilus assembly protein TadD